MEHGQGESHLNIIRHVIKVVFFPISKSKTDFGYFGGVWVILVLRQNVIRNWSSELCWPYMRPTKGD